jgi:DNA-binding GntR family transcriptional regulator
MNTETSIPTQSPPWLSRELGPLEGSADLVHRVSEALIRAICKGELPPGGKITQESVAEQLAVSRQPVLQAFRLLERDGLLIDTPNKKGMLVAPLDAAFVSNLYSIRAALDGLAARSAASFARIDLRGQGIELMRAGRIAAQNDDLDALVECDIRFHQFIYAASGNALLETTMQTHWHHTRRVMSTYLRLPANFRQVWSEHQAILDALVAGQAREAEKLAREHALSSVDVIFNHWQQEELNQLKQAERVSQKQAKRRANLGT